jgi:hypothetical protein
MSSADADTLYVYGLMEAAPAQTVTEADPSGRLLVVAASGVAAVCEAVAADTLAVAATDDDELAALARRHDAVVHLLAGYGPALPARMGTVCARDRLAEALERGRDGLVGKLQQLRGHHEWRLRIDRAARPEADRGGRSATGSDRTAMSGTEYLRRRRASRTALADAAPSVFPTLDSMMGEFSADAGDVLRSARGTAISRSYLVDDARVDTLLARVNPLIERAIESGERVSLAGPLPAYSFVDFSLGATA